MFEVDRVYMRSELHARFGGQMQGGISTPRKYPIILLFTGESGETYGYDDGWMSADTFRYSGEGQLGDMTFTRGNLAIRDHAIHGKDIHLFAIKDKGKVRYLGQMEYVGHDVLGARPDRNGKPRQAILFRLRKKN